MAKSQDQCNFFSSWTQLLQGVPLGLVLGPMVFNVYINDMFFALNEIDICNFADDTTPYVFDSKHLISGNKNEYIWTKLD